MLKVNVLAAATAAALFAFGGAIAQSSSSAAATPSFSAIDKNNDGQISRQEWSEYERTARPAAGVRSDKQPTATTGPRDVGGSDKAKNPGPAAGTTGSSSGSTGAAAAGGTGAATSTDKAPTATTGPKESGGTAAPRAAPRPAAQPRRRPARALRPARTRPRRLRPGRRKPAVRSNVDVNWRRVAHGAIRRFLFHRDAVLKKSLRFGKGFRVVRGNRASQAAEMVLAPGDTEGGADNRHRGADQWLFVLSGQRRGPRRRPPPQARARQPALHRAA